MYGEAIAGPRTELEQSISSDELSQLADEGIEAAFAVTEGIGDLVADEILPEIPIIKSLYAVVKASRGISDILLAKKVIRFLLQLQTISQEEREEFLSKLNSDDRERILGNLMLVLQRHETLQKSEIQGRLFAALIKGELKKQEYLLLTHATSMVNPQALPDLAKFYAGQLDVDPATTSLLYSFGFLQLVELDNSALGTYGGGQPAFQKTSLGQKYVDMVSR